jgi:hypothetical protein
MTTWNDFNNAENQSTFDVIPAKTPVKVRMTIKPGGFDNPHLGWTGGYVTRNSTTGAAYLNGEFVVLEGPYARRKVWSLIGLHSEKGPEWANMGRSFIRALLNSARGIHPKDDSPAAQSARCIQCFADLDGIEFAARIDVEKDQRSGEDRNVIRTVIQPDHPEYAALMGTGGFRAPVPASSSASAAPATFAAPAAAAAAAPGAAKPFRPAWAE